MGSRRGSARDFRLIYHMAERIHSIDAVRAVALLGILLAHAHNFFNIYQPQVPVGCADGVWNILYEGLFREKFFLIFSFLFGLSFFLQMDRAMAKGVDFRLRFCWRLVLLAGFGLLNSWFYCGDILLIFAITGVIPVLLWRVSTRWLVVLSGICLLQPLALYHDLSGTPDAMHQWYDGIRENCGLTWAPSSLTASFSEMGIWNISDGVCHSLLYVVYSYRIWALIGMFLLGMIAGRLRIFEGGVRMAPFLLVTVMIWGLVTCATTGNSSMAYWRIIEPTLFALVLIPALEKFFRFSWVQGATAVLGRLGRCTLTCYIFQNAIMVWLLCSYGAGLTCQLSVSAIMAAALILYLLQMSACNLWLRRFRYGPLEGVWRYLTRFGMRSVPARTDFN